MQVRNNYDLEVFNGDIGRVAAIDEAEQRGDGALRRPARSPTTPAELDELVLAYACSIHKSQGSEYPCVVIPLHTQHYVMLQRNLLYTALTRARRLAVLVGEKRALRVAVGNRRTRARHTRLAERANAPGYAAGSLAGTSSGLWPAARFRLDPEPRGRPPATAAGYVPGGRLRGSGGSGRGRRRRAAGGGGTHAPARAGSANQARSAAPSPVVQARYWARKPTSMVKPATAPRKPSMMPSRRPTVQASWISTTPPNTAK